MIYIKNLRDNKFKNEPYQFRVDRTSPLGNPFAMKSKQDRNEVCDMYSNYFYAVLIKRDYVMTYLHKIKDALLQYGFVELYCWCAPLRCHAETIKEVIEGRLF